MLKITIGAQEGLDTATNEFVTVPGTGTEVELEHSLVSISKWESKWQKPFLGPTQKTSEETVDYIRMMCLTPNVPEELFLKLNNDNVKAISEYMDSKKTATWFKEPTPGAKPARNKEVVTAEIVYFWMISYNIPMECQYWHFSKLLTLVRVANEKHQETQKKPKMSKSEMAAQRRSLNEQRRAEMNSRG